MINSRHNKMLHENNDYHSLLTHVKAFKNTETVTLI